MSATATPTLQTAFVFQVIFSSRGAEPGATAVTSAATRQIGGCVTASGSDVWPVRQEAGAIAPSGITRPDALKRSNARRPGPLAVAGVSKLVHCASPCAFFM